MLCFKDFIPNTNDITNNGSNPILDMNPIINAMNKWVKDNEIKIVYLESLTLHYRKMDYAWSNYTSMV